MVVALLSSGCRRRQQPDEDAAPADALSVSLQSALAVEYVDLSGEFRVAATPAQVPSASREVLRVVVESTPAGLDRQHVVNLSGDGGAVLSRVMSRERFEAWALARLPAAEGSRISLPIGGDPQHIQRPEDRATLFVTSWCGVCRRAKAQLESLGLDYDVYDVERDTAAAQGLLARAEELGAVIDRVPVLVLRGRVLVGFDPKRYLNLLGQPL